LVSEAAPPNPSLSLSFAATVAASYSDLIAEKLGLDAALESIRQAESKIQALPDGATDQQKQSAQSSRMFVYRGKAELLRDAGRREDALKTIEEGIAAIGADSRAASGLKSLRAQMTLVGSVAPELTKDRVQGEFSSLASLRGKVVLLDFTAHW
jgi:hypothetical protein